MSDKSDLKAGQTGRSYLIETPRLMLRHMKREDADSLLQIFSDPKAMKYFNVVFDRSQMTSWVQRNLEHQNKHGFSLYTVILKENNEIIGDCGLETDEIDGKLIIGIGYDFRRKYWNKGYATEAALAVRDYGFNHFGFDKISCWIDPENVASQRVAEKIGMKVEKTVIRGGKQYCLYSVYKEQVSA